MSRLLLVRHGQASLFSADYDRLSATGEAQSRIVGEHWLQHGMRIDRVFSGSLRRQRDTATLAGSPYRAASVAFPETEVLPGLDEFDSEALVGELLEPLRAADPAVDADASAYAASRDERARYRYLHRVLEALMRCWVSGSYDPARVERLVPWDAFAGGVREALNAIRRDAGSGETLAVFTSGGPVGIAVQTALGAPELAAAELNWRVYNASITQFTFSGSRVSLDSFNTVEHIPPEVRTYR